MNRTFSRFGFGETAFFSSLAGRVGSPAENGFVDNSKQHKVKNNNKQHKAKNQRFIE